jgi:TetR/AcrR family transcriptional regulator
MDTDSAAPVQAPHAHDQEVHTRLRLIEAGVQIFDRKGYAAAAVREIAEAAGVTKPVLYYHFGSKEGLLVAILNQGMRDFQATLDAGLARTGAARERLIRLCEDIYRMFEKNVPVVRVAHSVFLGPRDLAPKFDLTVFERQMREAIVRIITDGQRAGELRAAPADDAALAIMGILEGCTDRQMLPQCDQVGTDGLRRILNVLFDGLVTVPST